MRALISVPALVALCLAGCGKGENAGAEEARKEAERIQKEKEAAGVPAKVMKPPVSGETKIPCSQLIDTTAFQAALGEAEPLTVKDITKGETDAASSCSLMRGGKRPNEAEQKALLKKEGRLGVMAGDEICNVSAFCYTIEDEERFKKKCSSRKDQDNESMGTYACVQVVAVGADDVHVFRFFDQDTKCILQVRGGPSMIDNEVIRKCAIAARDTIGVPQITPGAAPAEPAPAADGSAAAGSGT